MARYYPNGSNRKKNDKDNQRQQEVNDATIHNPVTNWWDSNFQAVDNAWQGKITSERDYWIQSMIMGIPGVNGIFQANWNKQALEHYMNTYGLTWNDLISRNLFGGQFSNVSALRNTTNFVSDMIKELYS